MNVLEGLDGFGQVSEEAKASMAAAARGMAKSYGEAMRRNARLLEEAGYSANERAALLSAGGARLRNALEQAKTKSSPSPMEPGMPAPAAGPNIGTIVLVGGALVGVAGLAYFLLR
jgi:hypothetical protein